jgi:hypothetical protein
MIDHLIGGTTEIAVVRRWIVCDKSVKLLVMFFTNDIHAYPTQPFVGESTAEKIKSKLVLR